MGKGLFVYLSGAEWGDGVLRSPQQQGLGLDFFETVSEIGFFQDFLEGGLERSLYVAPVSCSKYFRHDEFLDCLGDKSLGFSKSLAQPY